MTRAELIDRRPHRGTWLQTERAAHEAWARLIDKSPLAAKIMHVLTARVGNHNAAVISQKNLARLAHASERGVRDALRVLEADRWLEMRQIGGRGTVKSAVFGAIVIASIDNGLGLLGLGSGEKFVITGGVLLLAVSVDSISRRGRESAGRA